MAKQMIKPYSFLLYFLSLLAFFMLGLFYAKWIEAGKGQMLAGGAIVLSYGLMGSFIGLCGSLIVTHKTNRKIIITLNIILATLLGICWLYFLI